MIKKLVKNLSMPKGFSKPMHAALLLLNIFGVFMVISANMTSRTTNRQLFLYGGKELVFVMIAYVMMTTMAMNFGLKKFKKHFVKITVIMIGSLLATLLFPAVGGDTKAWIRIGGFMTIQPSEFAKLFVMLLMASTIADKAKQTKNMKAYQILDFPWLIVATIAFIVMILQYDLGSSVIIVTIAYFCTLIPSNSKLTRTQNYMMLVFVFGVICVWFFTTPTGIEVIKKLHLPSFMLGRFQTSANPFIDIKNKSYQNYNALIGFYQGGLFGRGFGNSISKYGYLPEAQTDFILTIIVEELGLFGFLIVLIGYGVVVWQLLSYAFKVDKESDKMILIGMCVYLSLHFIFNVGGGTAMIPLTGVPLLLLSAGGSSRIAFMLGMGIAQNVIARHRTSKSGDLV